MCLCLINILINFTLLFEIQNFFNSLEFYSSTILGLKKFFSLVSSKQCAENSYFVYIYSLCQLFVYIMNSQVQDSENLTRKDSRMDKLKRFFTRKNHDSEDPHFKSKILGPEIRRLSKMESKSTNQLQDVPKVPASELKSRRANIKKFLTKRPQMKELQDKGMYVWP